MLAVDSLLRQVDSLLQSAYSAQTVELPDSARVNLTDAGHRLDRARRVFYVLGTAGRYQSIADNLGSAIAAYASADSDGSRRSARSQHEAANARTLLTRAEDILTVAPEATQAQALAAESAALSAVTPPPARHVVHHVTHHRGPRHQTLPLAHHRRSSHHTRPAVKVVTPTATPTVAPSPSPRPTNTPAPTPRPTARPVTRPARTTHHGPGARVLAALQAITTQRSALKRALQATSSCRATVDGLAGGNDPTGSSAILTCLRGGLAALGRVALGSLSSLPAFGSQRASITELAGNLDLARSELEKSQADIQAVDLPGTSADLNAAVAALKRARDSLSSIERGVKHTR